MADGSGRARFVHEASDDRRVSSELRVEHLHGDATADQRVLGLVDRAHSARADDTNDPVAARQHLSHVGIGASHDGENLGFGGLSHQLVSPGAHRLYVETR